MYYFMGDEVYTFIILLYRPLLYLLETEVQAECPEVQQSQLRTIHTFTWMFFALHSSISES